MRRKRKMQLTKARLAVAKGASKAAAAAADTVDDESFTFVCPGRGAPSPKRLKGINKPGITKPKHDQSLSIHKLRQSLSKLNFNLTTMKESLMFV